MIVRAHTWVGSAGLLPGLPLSMLAVWQIDGAFGWSAAAMGLGITGPILLVPSAATRIPARRASLRAE